MAYDTLDTGHLIFTPELLLWIWLTLQGYGGGLFVAPEVHELLEFMTLWTVLCLKGLVIQLIY